MIPLASKEYKSYLNQTNCHICQKDLEDKQTATLGTIVILLVNIELLHIT